MAIIESHPQTVIPIDLIEPEPDGPPLPTGRGPLSEWLLDVVGLEPDNALPPVPTVDMAVDPLGDDDLHLALHAIYELSYRGFAGVDDAWDRDPRIDAFRRGLERRFEERLREVAAERRLLAGAETVGHVLERFVGPSLSGHMAERGTVGQFDEFAIHRSAYQLKEADPHTRALPRFSGGRRAAFVETQADEAHGELFAAVLDSLGLDSTYGAYLDRLPGVTLATGNLISMLGGQRRLRAALLGHVAGFELTSVGPMTRYSVATLRLGLDEPVRRFYDVQVETDEHHGELAATVLAGGDLSADGLDPSEVCFGAAALLIVEDQFARHLLHAWSHGRSSLRCSPADAATGEHP
jgi:Iron-containing redox enzyme